MKYEVRFIADGEEQSKIVNVDTAAEAAETVRNEYPDVAQNFELIQVQLLDEPTSSKLENALDHA